MADTDTTDVHSPAPMIHDQPGNVDAHFPPQVVPNETDDPFWNPDTNEWAPSSEQHSTFGVAEPSHGDEPVADPMSSDQGYPASFHDGGATPDGHMNLLDAIRRTRSGETAPHAAVPVQRIEHIVTTETHASDQIRARTVRVSGTAPTVLLEQNPNRERALIKCITTNGIVILSPLRSGGNPTSAAVPAGAVGGYPVSTGDPIHEVDSSEGVEAVAANTGVQAFCDVAIWEEMKGTGHVPGLSG